MRSKHSDSRPVFGHGDQGERRADLVRQQHPACRRVGPNQPGTRSSAAPAASGGGAKSSHSGAAVNLTRPDGTLRQGKSAAVESADAADLDPVADPRAGWDTHVALAWPTRRCSASCTTPSAQQSRRPQGRGSASCAHGCTAWQQPAGCASVSSARWRFAPRRHRRRPDPVGSRTSQARPRPRRRHVDRRVTDGPERPRGHSRRRCDCDGGALRTVLPELSALSDAERTLMVEWLDRAISASQDQQGPQPTEDQLVCPRSASPARLTAASPAAPPFLQ
jgi:hypothetical protein